MVENKKYLLSGIKFNKKNPLITLDSIDEPSRALFDILDKEFTISRYQPRYCIGRYNLDNFDDFPCPNNAELLTKSKICSNCFQFNSFNPSFYNVQFESISDKQKRYNDNPHVVYLAWFSDDMVKVGISHQKRTMTRWCEQGARAAAIIKTCRNAYAAREFELFINKQLKIKEAISSIKKRKLIKIPFNFDLIIVNSKKILHELSEITTELNDNIEVINLSSYYFRDNIETKSIIDVSENKPLIISGKIVGLIGEIIIFKNENRIFNVSLKKMIGHMVRISNEIVPITFQSFQKSLF